QIKSFQAVTAFEFSQHIFNEKPNIVHFSGHGDKTNPDVNRSVATRMGRPDADEEEIEANDESGIFLSDDDKRGAHFVTTTFLENTFQMMVKLQGIPIKVVIFNACHSSEQAAVISKVVPYVVGTSWSVGDEAAIAFAQGFYFGITENMSIDKAFYFGVNNALSKGEPKDRFLLYKDGEKVEW
ncbi:MAG: CHAT domain-containing protein, partial [Bacteroidota bacterium]